MYTSLHQVKITENLKSWIFYSEEERVAIACEHEADVTVSCPHGYVISVYEAFYGRDDLTT